MYKQFYSLSTNPFPKNLGASDLFKSSSFNETLARLNYLKTSKGMGLITAAPGAGKTTALRAFASSLNSALYKPMYCPFSSGTVNDFYRELAIMLGEIPRNRKVDLFHQIQDAIRAFYYEKRITPVFILDEMHMASNKFLNDLSLLFNFSMDSETPFILVLSGLPHLSDRLQLNQNQSLNQRIIMRYEVKPLDKDEVKTFVSHNLSLAGASYDIFSASALEAITANSRGWPRVISNIAIHALIRGFQLKQEIINADIITDTINESGIR